MNDSDLWPWERPQLTETFTMKTALACFLTILYVLALCIAGAVVLAGAVAIVLFVLLCIGLALALCVLGLGILLVFGLALGIAALPCVALRAGIKRLAKAQPKTD